MRLKHAVQKECLVFPRCPAIMGTHVLHEYETGTTRTPEGRERIRVSDYHQNMSLNQKVTRFQSTLGVSKGNSSKMKKLDLHHMVSRQGLQENWKSAERDGDLCKKKVQGNIHFFICE